MYPCTLFFFSSAWSRQGAQDVAVSGGVASGAKCVRWHLRANRPTPTGREKRRVEHPCCLDSHVVELSACSLQVGVVDMAATFLFGSLGLEVHGDSRNQTTYIGAARFPLFFAAKASGC